MPGHSSAVTTIDDPSLDELCSRLREQSARADRVEDWPARSLQLCADAGVYRWFLDAESGGFGWDEIDRTRGYLRLSAADLTTTFVITQYMGAIRRIVSSDNPQAAQRWLQPLLDGKAFGTVGISHLTTSRRHLAKPVMRVTELGDGRYQLDGMAPWVTGAPHADVIVIGGATDDGREILAAVPTASADTSLANPTAGSAPRLVTGPGIDLVALSASCTDRVTLTEFIVEPSMLLAGPVANVMSSGIGARTGGLQTSTLAIGLSRAAVDYLQEEATKREELRDAATELCSEVDQIETELIRAAGGDASCDASELRGRANRLALRSTQAALTAAKGAGYVTGHPVGRWCQQALFFLVWSCPQPVAQAHLCELAGLQ
tara:strand:+ start:1723 stop:2847 length:1125 start_codon:yes stop_codon:yes gene_type:complete